MEFTKYNFEKESNYLYFFKKKFRFYEKTFIFVLSFELE